VVAIKLIDRPILDKISDYCSTNTFQHDLHESFAGSAVSYCGQFGYFQNRIFFSRFFFFYFFLVVVRLYNARMRVRVRMAIETLLVSLHHVQELQIRNSYFIDILKGN
jgi:hypothetical protein